jgi:hypothetical protein
MRKLFEAINQDTEMLKMWKGWLLQPKMPVGALEGGTQARVSAETIIVHG